MPDQEQADTRLSQITRANAPERSGRRTPLLSRLVQRADVINKPLQLLYDPPDHSHDNPSESGWGLLEWQWNGAKLIAGETMLGWAKKMTWQGLHPVVALSRTVYEKGMALRRAAMQAVEARWQREPQLPKYDMLVNPASPS